MPRPRRSSLRELTAELRRTEARIDQINAKDDPQLLKTRLAIATSKAKSHSIRHRIAQEELDRAKKSKDRSRWMAQAEYEDRRHHEWETQVARLSAQQKNDLLPEILRRLDERERQADQLQGLTQDAFRFPTPWQAVPAGADA